MFRVYSASFHTITKYANQPSDLLSHQAATSLRYSPSIREVEDTGDCWNLKLPDPIPDESLSVELSLFKIAPENICEPYREICIHGEANPDLESKTSSDPLKLNVDDWDQDQDQDHDSLSSVDFHNDQASLSDAMDISSFLWEDMEYIDAISRTQPYPQYSRRSSSSDDAAPPPIARHRSIEAETVKKSDRSSIGHIVTSIKKKTCRDTKNELTKQRIKKNLRFTEVPIERDMTI